MIIQQFAFVPLIMSLISSSLLEAPFTSHSAIFTDVWSFPLSFRGISSNLEIWSWYHSFAAGKRHPSAHRFQRRSAPAAHFFICPSSVILESLRDMKSIGSRLSVVLILREFRTPRAYSSVDSPTRSSKLSNPIQRLRALVQPPAQQVRPGGFS